MTTRFAICLAAAAMLAAGCGGSNARKGPATPGPFLSHGMQGQEPGYGHTSGSYSGKAGGAESGAWGGGNQNGAQLYAANCEKCHQPKGTGIPGAIPPLAHNPTVTGNAENVIEIVKYGKSGRLRVKGATYDGTMPAWRGQLDDAQIASVVSYIRSAWGNRASAVTKQQVSKADRLQR